MYNWLYHVSVYYNKLNVIDCREQLVVLMASRGAVLVQNQSSSFLQNLCF